VTGRTDFYPDFFKYGSADKSVTASASNFGIVMVCRMYIFFHGFIEGDYNRKTLKFKIPETTQDRKVISLLSVTAKLLVPKATKFRSSFSAAADCLSLRVT